MMKTNKSNTTFCRVVATIALGCLSLLQAQAQTAEKPISLKLSSWVPAQHALNPALQAWADDLKAASGGTITSTLFPSEQLGKAFDHYDMAKDGIADFSYVNPGYQPGRFPIFSALSLPFLINNAKAGSAAMDVWYRPYAVKEMKDIHFCFAFAHDPGTFHSRKKILLPTDINGMKIRPATATIGQMVTLLGGTNVQASAPESRDMLERGVAETITFPWGSLSLFGIDKVVKFHMDTPLYVTPFIWAMNKDKYESMSAAQKKVIDSHCTSEWAEKVGTAWADFEISGHNKLIADPGREVYKLTPDQLAAWKKATQPLEKQWAEDVKKRGEDPVLLMNNLRQTLTKYKSLLQ
jgi:TRAP-type transport system periplasmic protein